MDIVIPIFPDFTALDAIGPYEVLRSLPDATVTFAAAARGVVRTDSKMVGLHADASFAEMCASIPPLSPREVADALNTARSIAEHLALFMDGIARHYARFPRVPRVPCELISE